MIRTALCEPTIALWAVKAAITYLSWKALARIFTEISAHNWISYKRQLHRLSFHYIELQSYTLLSKNVYIDIKLCITQKATFVLIWGITPSDSPGNSGLDCANFGDGYFQKLPTVFWGNVHGKEIVAGGKLNSFTCNLNTNFGIRLWFLDTSTIFVILIPVLVFKFTQDSNIFEYIRFLRVRNLSSITNP